MAFRKPTTKLSRHITYSQEYKDFLNSIRPWGKSHWSNSFGTPEQHNIRNEIKAFIKSELEIIQDNYCAFCGINLTKVHEVHREHIAPQYKHPHYIFEEENLVLSCCYCNKHKGRYLTVVNDTNDYSTTTFKILHPHKDNYSDYLDCDFDNRQIVFTIIGNQRVKTRKTISVFGLNEPHLMTIRGGIIFQELYPVTANENDIINNIISSNRNGN